ncbi:ectoine/hydroxyectoine ABC transporter permease subunit EhuD [Paenibacillus tarimensis]|uniref:ectoine/hydroxyectoine ABC transporter permease subunit EhuD n=1 Tax=Paenibacillus tarimensis TaxID=416012 RepID=UPI001F329FD0|nr:ectoine/hydroxyectoine ABC transporter permease subunit EhuD [Paenibacillus tarimensis]MCF2943730.1 ectoine/hydroxyectoine ABC transporter permease subunit EhuD [Paenibacillus tarimensis]
MWNWDYAWSILPDLIAALKTTFWATFGGFIFAAIGGLMLALLGRSPIWIIRAINRLIIEFIRSTPLLVQLFFLYFYILPTMFPTAPTALVSGIIGLGLHYSTYMSEVYRSGIDAVPKGQWEAAKALNFPRSKTWTSIILPQALPPTLPVMGNYLIVIFKETPLLSAITLVEVLTTAKNAISVSYRPFEAYTLVGVIFLIISYMFSLLVRMMEIRLNREQSASSGTDSPSKPQSGGKARLNKEVKQQA